MLITECLQHQPPKHRLHVEFDNRLPQRVFLQILRFSQGRKNGRKDCKQFSLFDLRQHRKDLQIQRGFVILGAE
ncbi:hypothetical protein D9M68_835960 [compost metagenome]